MASIFNGGMPSLSAFVGCFGLSTSGYPRVASGSSADGWRAAGWSSENHAAFVVGARDVLEDAREFSRGRTPGPGGEIDIPGTMWSLALEEKDQFRLWRPRFSIAVDLSGAPWTDFLELRKEHLPREGRRRFISQKLRRTSHAGEPLREIKEMEFSRSEIDDDFGKDPRALGLLEHQLAMQFNTPAFHRLNGRSGHVLTLDPREAAVARWRPYSLPTPSSEADKNAPTPAQGIPLTDPEYPHRVYFESDPLRDYFRIYMSLRDPEPAALALSLGIKHLWERIEYYAETADRTFAPAPSAGNRRA